MNGSMKAHPMDKKKIGFFTLALGRICRVESLTSTKLIAVIARYVATPPLIPVSPSSAIFSSIPPSPC